MSGMPGNYQPALNMHYRPRNYSVLPTADLASPGVYRAPRGANPVNASGSGSRGMMSPVEGGPGSVPQADISARSVHPRLNTTPWNIAYAQQRSEPKNARAKGNNAGRRRSRQIAKMQKNGGQ